MKQFLKTFWIFALYGVRPRTLCYGGEPSSQLDEDEARAEADAIPPAELPAILAGHRAGNRQDTARLLRGFAYLVFRVYRKREEYLRKNPGAKRKKRSADDLLGKWYFDLAEQLDRCADPNNKSFAFPAERIEGYIIGGLLKSDASLTAEEYREVLGWLDPHGRAGGQVCDSHTTEEHVMLNEHRKMLMPELRRIAPFAETRFEKSVIGLALSDFDVEEIRDALNKGVSDAQIVHALEAMRERADKAR